MTSAEPSPPPTTSVANANTSVATLGDLARAVLTKQLEALRAHEPGTRLGADLEALHDMRVATRRLRAALRCFASVWPPPAESVRTELGWLGQSLSGVRDLDVELQQLNAWRDMQSEVERAALDRLIALIAAERVRARQELLAKLDSERYSALLVNLEEVLRSELHAEASLPLHARAPALIKRPYRKLRKLGDTLDRTSPAAELHALRIRAKRLRYIVEFLADQYGPPADRFVRSVVKLQDLLGTHQDAQVAIQRLRTMLTTHASELSNDVVFLMGELAQQHADTAADLRARFPRTYRGVIGRRWKALRRELRALHPQH
jgi:triphosphatase